MIGGIGNNMFPPGMTGGMGSLGGSDFGSSGDVLQSLQGIGSGLSGGNNISMQSLFGDAKMPQGGQSVEAILGNMSMQSLFGDFNPLQQQKSVESMLGNITMQSLFGDYNPLQNQSMTQGLTNNLGGFLGR